MRFQNLKFKSFDRFGKLTASMLRTRLSSSRWFVRQLTDHHKFFRIRTLIILAIFSLLILLGVVIWKFSVVERVDEVMSKAIYSVKPKSIVEVSVDQESASQSATVNLKFTILENEQTKFDELARKLDLGQSWPQEITIGVNEETKGWLEGLFPLNLNLSLNDQILSFGNLTLQGLVSAQTRNEYKYASGEGSLRMYISNVHDIDLEIDDLRSVINEASRSGELYVSSIVNPIGGVVDQVKGVAIRVIGKRVSGQIEFWP